MADPDPKAGKASDPLAASSQPPPPAPESGPLTVDEEKPRTTREIPSQNDTDIIEPIVVEKEELKVHGDSTRAELKLTKSYATDTSAATGVTTAPSQHKDPRWYKNLNPLRWGSIPPVPKERTPSKEYKAGFFSLLTFQWMSSLMTVS